MKTKKPYNWLISEDQAEKIRKLGFDKDDKLLVKLFEKSRSLVLEPYLEMPSLEKYGSNYYRDYLDNPDKYLPLYTYEQVFEWFREKGLVAVIVTNEILNEGDPLYFSSVDDLDGDYYTLDNYYTYEEARDAVLNKLIELYGNNI